MVNNRPLTLEEINDLQRTLIWAVSNALDAQAAVAPPAATGIRV
jgi:hypothetical protein